MFCTNCTAAIPADAGRCLACGMSYTPDPTHSASASKRKRAHRARQHSILARWGMVVPLLLTLVVASSFLWQIGSDRMDRADAYAQGEQEMAAGNYAAASESFAEAGSYRDALQLRANALEEIAPYRASYLDGLAAMDAGNYETAFRLFTDIQSALPEYEDIDARVVEAKTGLLSDIEEQLDVALVRHEWLEADRLLTRLVVLEPENEERPAALQELRAHHAPLVYAFNGDLYLIGPDMSDQRLLVDDIPVAAPSWSPDRSRIAFLSINRSKGSSVSLYVVDADGSNRQRISENASHDPNFAWSPDGSQIAYIRTGGMVASSRDYRSTIVINDLQTGSERVIEPISLIEHDDDISIDTLSPTWSPDGKQLAFVAIRHPTGPGSAASNRFGDVQVIDLETDEVRSLTDHATPYVATVSWSPLDNHLLVWESRAGTAWYESSETSIYLVDASTGEMERLTSRTEVSGRPIWSPDGKRFAFLLDNGTLRVRWIPGKRETNTSINNPGAYFSWSPTGDALIISSYDSTVPSIRVDLDATTAVRSEIGIAFDSEWPNLGLQWSSGYAPGPKVESE